MSQGKAVYAASLDPITNGHLWVIDQGSRLFDSLFIAVAVNPAKASKYFFTEKERLDLVESCLPDFPDIVSIGNRYLVDFAKERSITHLLRGARNSEDFAAEVTMAEMNRKMAAKRGFSLETVILTPPHEISMISSSFVKGLIGYDGWQKEVEQYVPQPVVAAILKKVFKK